MRATLVAIASLALLGCGGAPANRDADQTKAAIGTETGTDITPAVGAVQADLHLEYLQAGDNAAKASYLHRIDLCEQMGLGGARLDAAEVDRLGTARVQLWTTPERSAARLERYQWVNGPIESRRHCEFSARVDGVHYYVDRDTLTTIDLRTGNVTSEPTPYAHLWQRGAVSGEDVRGGTTTSRHGMSCMEYPLGHPDSTAGGGSYCVWSEGSARGFSARGFPLSEASGVTSLFNGLVIDQTPNDQGHGIRVTLRELTEVADIPAARMRPYPADTSAP